jgi:KipI family sensor histidine kinase inhibitor
MSGATSVKSRFQPASDQTLLVHFGPEISLTTHRQIVSFLKLLEAEPVEGILNLHPAYGSVLVKFDALRFTHLEMESRFAPYLSRLNEVSLPEPRRREVPVCYGAEYGPDLPELARLHKIKEEEVVHLHSSAEYIVYFLGFVPGFAYLGGLPRELETPRLASPRKKVPAGSVAIGGNQTGVYPISTPGGWRLIGRTPISLFRPEADEKSYLSIGDRVAFVPITSERFEELAGQ